MTHRTAWALATLLLLPLAGAEAPKAKAKAKAPTVASLKAEVKELKEALEVAREKLAATDALEAELESARKSRDAYKDNAEALQKELDLLKASLKENQSSGEAILKDLLQAREAAKAAQEENARLKADLGQAKARLAGGAEPGSLVPLSPDVVPARPINLRQVTPSRKKVDRGVVVVNVLVNESGEVTEVRLLQGLPGEGEWVVKAHEACLDAAKRLVFDPARTTAGVKVKVWQGVGFFLD